MLLAKNILKEGIAKGQTTTSLIQKSFRKNCSVKNSLHLPPGDYVLDSNVSEEVKVAAIQKIKITQVSEIFNYLIMH